MANDNGPIRAVVAGQESVFGTETTQYHQILAEGVPNHQDMFGRKLIRVQNSTYTGATLRALGPRHSTLQMKVPLLFDGCGYLFTHLFGFPATTPLGSGAYRHEWLFPQPVSAAAWASESVMVFNNVRWAKMLGGRAVVGKLDFSAIDIPMLDINYLFRAAAGDDSTTAPSYDVPDAFGAMGSRQLQVNMNDVSAELIKGSIDFDNKLVPFWTATRTANMKRQKRNGLSDAKFDFLFDWIDYANSVKDKYDHEQDLGKIDAEWVSASETISTSGIPPRLLVTCKNLIIENSDEQEDQGESAVHATGQGDYVAGPPAATASVVLDNNIASYAANA